jgi:ligand-binding sensor domain-containing protein/signal transduction histidine kinase
MKELNLRLYCLNRLQVLKDYFRILLQLKYMVPLFFLAACTGTPKDDGTSPGPLFLHPQSIAANPEGGYLVNPLTGDSLQPIINSLGDTVLTGVSIPARPKVIHPDSVSQPKVVKAPAIESLAKHKALPNRHKIPKNIPTIPIDISQLKTMPVKLPEQQPGGVLDTAHYLINSTGDTIPTGVPVPARGKLVKAIQPKPTKALPPAIKDAAISNLQYLNVDQGMNASYVYSLLEDKSGNLWFGTNGGGVSKYDGESFTHFTEKEGLSNNSVWSILEDKSGNLWFGTLGGGVSKYDGESFTHFTEKEGLSNNRVLSIMEDKSGNLWFGTEGGGVSKYDPAESGTRSESFTHFTEKEGLSNNSVFSILEDKSGNLWFGTNGGGVIKFDGESFSYFTEKEGLSNNSVWSILEDKCGNLWFGSWDGGVSKFDGESFRHFTEKEGLSDNSVLSILEDKSGNLWFGTFGGGASKYNGDSFHHFTEQEGLSNNIVFSILEDKSGNLWFGTIGGGVSKYNRESFRHFAEKEVLSSINVLSILEDKSGNLWFGTLDGGVSKYDGESFRHFTEQEGLSDNSVRSIVEDKSGNLWFGTFGGGVSKYDGESFTHFTEKEGLSNNTVLSALEDKNGNLWFGTNGGGVSQYDGESFRHFTEKEGLSNNTVLSLLEDKSGNLWFGTFGGGVSKYDRESFTHFTEKEGLSNNNVRSMMEDENGNLWFGTLGGGVSKYDGKSFYHFTEKEGLSNNRVLSILEGKSNTIWLGTERGLIQIEARPEPAEGSKDEIGVSLSQKVIPTVQVFGKQDGLKGLHFFANSVFLDGKNRAWWGNVKGLSMLDLNTFQLAQNPPVIFLKQLDVNEEFIDYRNISDSLGQNMQFSGVAPFTNYPLNLELPYNKNHLTFHFAAIEWSAPHKIKYSYRMLGLNNNWSVASKEAKADYRNLPYGTYTFQIKAIGESGAWSEPFEYTFTIRPPWWHSWWAYLIYGFLLLGLIRRGHIFQKARTIRKERERSQQKELEQAKEIEKAYNNLEVAHESLKSAQAQLIQSEKMASLGELTAGIAHEIKNPLNFVNNFSEVSIEMIDEIREELANVGANNDSPLPVANSPLPVANSNSPHQTISEILDDIEANLRKIHGHGSRADGIVKSMLLHSRGGNGKMEPIDINAMIREYVNLSFHGMRAGKHPINVDIKMDLDDTIGDVPLIAEDFSRVILNLCNNAFYAMRDKLATNGANGVESNPKSQNYNPSLSVRTKSNNNRITIEIEDNGPGIPDDIKDKILQPFFTTKKGTEGTGLGLSITNDIVKAHGGELSLKTNQGEGTNFIIVLPLSRPEID